MRFTLYSLFTMILADHGGQDLTNAEDRRDSLTKKKAFRAAWLTHVRKVPRFGNRCRPRKRGAGMRRQT
jgi:hypothetical protein